MIVTDNALGWCGFRAGHIIRIVDQIIHPTTAHFTKMLDISGIRGDTYVASVIGKSENILFEAVLNQNGIPSGFYIRTSLFYFIIFFKQDWP